MAMRWRCKECGTMCIVRSSRMPHPDMRESSLLCRNPDCGWRGVVVSTLEREKPGGSLSFLYTKVADNGQ